MKSSQKNGNSSNNNNIKGQRVLDNLNRSSQTKKDKSNIKKDKIPTENFRSNRKECKLIASRTILFRIYF